MTFEEEMKAVAIEILGDEGIGFEGVISRSGGSTYNTETLKTESSSTISFPVLAAFSEPPDSRQYETQLRSEEFAERKWMTIIPLAPGEPKAGDILTAEGRDIRLEGVNPIGPKREPIYYRAYAER